MDESDLLAAADAGVACDGLRVERTDAGITVETPAGRHEGLSDADARAILAEHPRLVDNWAFWADRAPDRDDYRAFLRWLEHAEERPLADRSGTTREWGEILVRTTVAEDGTRTYDLRHRADRDADPAALDPIEPEAADDLATTDADGQYRPLRTAPTLRAGWIASDLDAHACPEFVATLYPATIANWHREREGRLDVTHFDAAAARQTGIYAVVDELPREALTWLANASCTDAMCLKRRAWDAGEGDPIDAPRGDGEMPCREPCSLVIAAAREFANAEQESPRSSQFELTPSEYETLLACLDAVAGDRSVRLADLGEGANRYRARYLRAKRFSAGGPGDRDEHGHEHDEHGDGDEQ
ncbi:MAG: DR2241 family protein [Halococcoides sp.]